MKRVLMCAPDYFEIAYEINPWMHVDGTLLVSYLDAELEQTLSALHIKPKLLDMSEFKKSGGGI